MRALITAPASPPMSPLVIETRNGDGSVDGTWSDLSGVDIVEGPPDRLQGKIGGCGSNIFGQSATHGNHLLHPMC
ncbi:hypothetical protein GCM10010327_54490 [Streptomyces nitrosporeus]|nr:hypothetical protein GCM10010327_54490 [Streptomyces nitrosporeus]